jgi:hypothetical protein
MRLFSALLACCLLLVVGGSSARAATGGPWTGKATSMDRDFNYGKVTFKVKGSTIRGLQIEAVTVSGCGGFMTLVIPRARIDGRRFTGAYQPVPGTDQIVSVNGTFRGNTVKGTFSAGPLCQGAGRFTARAG